MSKKINLELSNWDLKRLRRAIATYSSSKQYKVDCKQAIGYVGESYMSDLTLRIVSAECATRDMKGDAK